MINIIPKPVKIEAKKGKITLSAKSQIKGEFVRIQNVLKDFLSSYQDATDSVIEFICDNKLESEGYAIEMDGNKVSIKASDEKGAFYATQTIIQLCAYGNTIDTVNINDKPNYKWRGFMLDSARHYWPVDHIKSMMDVMANLKLNIFHWHITDDQGWRIEIKKHPQLTEHGSIRKATQLAVMGGKFEEKEYGRGLYYTQEEIKDLIAYAGERCIEIIPEIDMPGHLVAAISCYPELSCEGKPIDVSIKWGVLDVIGCCGNDKLYEFVKDVLDEVCDLFPSEYFHIGGDEVPKTKWKKCPKCQAKIKELGLSSENELQGYFNNFVCDYIKGKGKHLIGWNEILDASTLAKDVIIQWWTPAAGKAKAIEWISNGGKAILSKHQDFYMDHSFAIRPLRKTYDFKYSSLGISDRTNVLGIEAPQWTEYVRTKKKFDFNTYPRMMALAECAWTMDDIKNYREFSQRLEEKRSYFENKFNIKMADKFTYEGNSVKCKFFMREARGWVKWRNDPNHELK